MSSSDMTPLSAKLTLQLILQLPGRASACSSHLSAIVGQTETSNGSRRVNSQL